MHAGHSRSVETVGGRLASLGCWPGRQVVQGLQAAPACVLNWPELHREHTRSEVSVGAASSCSPSWQLLTGLHGSVPALVVKVLWSTHCSHTRSEVAVGCADAPEPASHTRIRVHSRSLETVAAVDSNSPPGKHDLVGWQGVVMPSTSLKVSPTTQAAQTRSDVSVGAASSPWPMGQVRTLLQLRSEVAVGATLSYDTPDVHCVVLVQTVSEAAEQARVMYSLPDPVSQVLHALHTPPLWGLNVPELQSAHWRFELLVGATDSCCPIGHTEMGSQLPLPTESL